MKQLLKSFLLRSRLKYHQESCSLFLILTILLYSQISIAQIANYVNNGGFEEISYPPGYRPKHWGATDTSKIFGELLSEIVPPYKVPLSSYTFQWPRSGHNHLIALQYCTTCPNNKRGYPRNRLKGYLQLGKIYCVTFYVNLSNQSTHGIDAIGAYFGDSSLDTITQCNVPITYLTPQVKNPLGNIIVDTLSWVPITGTFVANGTEKYILIGNFKSDVNTNTTLSNSLNLPANAGDYLFDDVSVIDVELPAHAGNDTTCILGDSIYIGRRRDVGIDEACIWYKYPDMLNPIDTAAGIWIKPVATSTYIVRQQLWCSDVKWDTIIVYQDFVGIEKLKILSAQIHLLPVPSNEYVELRFSNATLFRDFKTIRIYNQLSQLVREEELVLINNVATISTSDLPNGVYSLQLVSDNSEIVSKKLLIAK